MAGEFFPYLVIFAYFLILVLLFLLMLKRLRYLLNKQIMHTGIHLLTQIHSKLIKVLFVIFFLLFIGSIVIIVTFL